MQQKACCFSSHKDFIEGKVDMAAIKRRISNYTSRAATDGYTRFICTFTSEMDFYFAQRVLRLCEKQPETSLEAVIVTESWREKLARSRATRNLFSSCATVHVCSQNYERDSYILCAKYMLAQSSRLIAVYDGRVHKDHTVRTIAFAEDMDIETKIIRT